MASSPGRICNYKILQACPAQMSRHVGFVLHLQNLFPMFTCFVSLALTFCDEAGLPNGSAPRLCLSCPLRRDIHPFLGSILCSPRKASCPYTEPRFPETHLLPLQNGRVFTQNGLWGSCCALSSGRHSDPLAGPEYALKLPSSKSGPWTDNMSIPGSR